MELSKFYKRREQDQIWWVITNTRGPMYFSFDRKKIFNFWTDYPDKLTPKEKEIFDRENPILAGLREG